MTGLEFSNTVTRGLRAGVFSRGIRAIPFLENFFEFEQLVWRPSPHEVDVVLTWGNKESSREAREFAERASLPLWRLEDGFFRSLGVGVESPPLSLIVDDVGIYYDATGPSRLENLLNEFEVETLSTALLERTRATLEFVTKHHLSKYNHTVPGAVSQASRPRVLLVDQTYGDASVRDGLATEESFEEMIEWALHEYQDAEIVVKTHPEVIRGNKKGYIPRERLRGGAVRLETTPVCPGELLESVSQVLTVTSQLGFEALCFGKPVTCFGAPFYSGWGLTEDRRIVGRRKGQRSLLELLAASWFLYPAYIDPLTGQRCQAESVLDHFALQRGMFTENRGRTVAVGFSGWKQPAVAKFLGGPGASVRFCSEKEAEKAVDTGTADRVVVWGQRGKALAVQCAASQVQWGIVEDGFLRSAQLGSDLTPPGSLVFDMSGIYYDATRKSDLETFLAEHEFCQDERDRAEALCSQIRKARLSKYNVQRDQPLSLPAADTRRRILIVGQVDDDASLALGAGREARNGNLVSQVRRAHPQAFLIYKPHPDVLAGNRKGALKPEEVALLDHVEKERSIVACLDAVQEVHTYTSLVGFEALLRGLPVTAYGLPFYAGWGLTTDIKSEERRSRRLELSELVYGALIFYPRYYSHRVDCFITPEEMIAELQLELSSRAREESITPSISRKVKRFGRYLKGKLHEG